MISKHVVLKSKQNRMLRSGQGVKLIETDEEEFCSLRITRNSVLEAAIPAPVIKVLPDRGQGDRPTALEVWLGSLREKSPFRRSEEDFSER